MVTRIKDRYADNDWTSIQDQIQNDKQARIEVRQGSTGVSIAVISKDDLKNALREEFGWIVVESNSLVTEIEQYSDTHVMVGGELFSKTIDPEMARAQGQRWLTMAEYLEAQPKIDPADVEALTPLLRSVDAPGSYGANYHEDMARKLLATGKVEVKKDA